MRLELLITYFAEICERGLYGIGACGLNSRFHLDAYGWVGVVSRYFKVNF